jgi:hypothetical protein
MRKIYLFLANTVFVFHGLLVVFILFGWLFPNIKTIYLVVLLLWLSSWIFLGYCPPTKWEFLLRKKYDNNIDPNAEAIQYYMYQFFKKDISSETIFTGGLILSIILILLTIFI